MPSLESSIVAAVVRYLKTLPCIFIWKTHGGPYGQGMPDIYCLYRGETFWFEVKRPGKTATRLQEEKIKALRAAGATAEVVTSLDEVKQIIGGEGGAS